MFLRRGKYEVLFNVDIVNLLLKKTMRGDTEHIIFIFVVWSALVVSGWVVAAWSRKSYLGPAKISSVVYLVKFKDRGGRVSCLYCFS